MATRAPSLPFRLSGYNPFCEFQGFHICENFSLLILPLVTGHTSCPRETCHFFAQPTSHDTDLRSFYGFLSINYGFFIFQNLI